MGSRLDALGYSPSNHPVPSGSPTLRESVCRPNQTAKMSLETLLGNTN